MFISANKISECECFKFLRHFASLHLCKQCTYLSSRLSKPPLVCVPAARRLSPTARKEGMENEEIMTKLPQYNGRNLKFWRVRHNIPHVSTAPPWFEDPTLQIWHAPIYTSTWLDLTCPEMKCIHPSMNTSADSKFDSYRNTITIFVSLVLLFMASGLSFSTGKSSK